MQLLWSLHRLFGVPVELGISIGHQMISKTVCLKAELIRQETGLEAVPGAIQRPTQMYPLGADEDCKRVLCTVLREAIDDWRASGKVQVSQCSTKRGKLPDKIKLYTAAGSLRTREPHRAAFVVVRRAKHTTRAGW